MTEQGGCLQGIRTGKWPLWDTLAVKTLLPTPSCCSQLLCAGGTGSFDPAAAWSWSCLPTNCTQPMSGRGVKKVITFPKKVHLGGITCLLIPRTDKTGSSQEGCVSNCVCSPSALDLGSRFLVLGEETPSD